MRLAAFRESVRQRSYVSSILTYTDVTSTYAARPLHLETARTAFRDGRSTSRSSPSPSPFGTPVDFSGSPPAYGVEHAGLPCTSLELIVGEGRPV